jgi:DNA repair protein RadC
MHIKLQEKEGHRYLTIQEWAEEDRPRERLLKHGSSVLSNAELLAILMGSGVQNVNSLDLAKHMLKAHDQDLDALAQQSPKELQRFKGIGAAKAATIASALTLATRRNEDPSVLGKKKKIEFPRQAYEVMKPDLMGKVTEEFWVLLLNHGKRLIKKQRISIGGLTRTVVDPKMVFKVAIDHKASALILVHNHPSGQLEASASDIQLTRGLVTASEVLDVQIADHIIFTDKGYFSFVEEGVLKQPNVDEKVYKHIC